MSNQDTTNTTMWIASIAEALADIEKHAPERILVGGELHLDIRKFDIEIWKIRDAVIEQEYRN